MLQSIHGCTLFSNIMHLTELTDLLPHLSVPFLSDNFLWAAKWTTKSFNNSLKIKKKKSQITIYKEQNEMYKKVRLASSCSEGAKHVFYHRAAWLLWNLSSKKAGKEQNSSSVKGQRKKSALGKWWTSKLLSSVKKSIWRFSAMWSTQ